MIIKYGLFLGSTLFVLGLITVILRRNFLFILIGLEIMINAAALCAVFAGNYLNTVDGQIIFIVCITIAAVESSIGLSLLIKLYRKKNNLDIDIINEMKR